MDDVKVLNLKVKVNEVEGKKFYHFDIGGDERHIKRIWINSLYYETELKKNLDEYNETVGILKNAKVEKTNKGNYVIRKGNENLFFIMIRCGYRGTSRLEAIEIGKEKVVEFDYYHSPKGNLGISFGAIISTAENSVKVRWIRTGRLYGQPDKGTSVVHIDGRIESVSLVPEELEEIESI